MNIKFIRFIIITIIIFTLGLLSIYYARQIDNSTSIKTGLLRHHTVIVWKAPDVPKAIINYQKEDYDNLLKMKTQHQLFITHVNLPVQYDANQIQTIENEQVVKVTILNGGFKDKSGYVLVEHISPDLK